MSLGNGTINSIIKMFAFDQSIKAGKKKFKIKSEFLFNHVSTETIKRIINDIDIKKTLSGEIPTSFFFFKCNFVLETVTVSENEPLETGPFPDSLKCGNVRPIYKTMDPFDKS